MIDLEFYKDIHKAYESSKERFLIDFSALTIQEKVKLFLNNIDLLTSLLPTSDWVVNIKNEDDEWENFEESLGRGEIVTISNIIFYMFEELDLQKDMDTLINIILSDIESGEYTNSGSEMIVTLLNNNVGSYRYDW